MKIEFNINDHIARFFIRIFRGKKTLWGFLFAFCIGSALVYAVTPMTLTNTFMAGDTIFAAEINQNFQDIKAKVDELASVAIPVGTIVPFAGATAPTGWFICNGAAISRTTYSALYAAIGVAWGYGNNADTFNIPDLRGRFLRGVDNAAGNDPDAATRTAINPGGNSGDNVGSHQYDAFQGHFHDSGAIYTSYWVSPGAGLGLAVPGSTASPKTDGTNGAPRTSQETRPKNANVNYIIKY